MSRTEFIRAWNRAFYPEGQYNNEVLDIEVALVFPGGKTSIIEVKGVTPKTRINEIARLYANSLADESAGQGGSGAVEAKSGPVQQESPEEAPSAAGEAEREVVANEHVGYRKNTYLVQHYRIGSADRFSIFKGDGSKVGPDTVTGRAILKKYREGFVTS